MPHATRDPLLHRVSSIRNRYNGLRTLIFIETQRRAMIAADSANHAATLREQTLWQRRRSLRFHSVNMTNFLFDLVSNLVLLAIVLSACHLCNRLIPGAALNGAHVFVALISAALLLDAALTFLVFADAQSRYGTFSTPAAFVERA